MIMISLIDEKFAKSDIYTSNGVITISQCGVYHLCRQNFVFIKTGITFPSVTSSLSLALQVLSMRVVTADYWSCLI